jgi:hypothetical protein
MMTNAQKPAAPFRVENGITAHGLRAEVDYLHGLIAALPPVERHGPPACHRRPGGTTDAQDFSHGHDDTKSHPRTQAEKANDIASRASNTCWLRIVSMRD